jgi:hypothetical protein
MPLRHRMAPQQGGHRQPGVVGRRELPDATSGDQESPEIVATMLRSRLTATSAG